MAIARGIQGGTAGFLGESEDEDGSTVVILPFKDLGVWGRGEGRLRCKGRVGRGQGCQFGVEANAGASW